MFLISLVFTLILTLHSTEIIINPYDSTQEYYEYMEDQKLQVTVHCAEGFSDCYHDNQVHTVSNNHETEIYNQEQQEEELTDQYVYKGLGYIRNQSYIDPYIERVKREAEIELVVGLKQLGYSTFEAMEYVEFINKYTEY